MTNYTKTMMDALAEVRGLVEASMKPAQIAQLKKAYEPMRDKKISVSNANKLSALMDKFADNKDVLIQLVKADIPFVSTAAVTRLISKHGMKGAEINKFKKEEMEFWAELDEGKEKDARQLVDPKKEVMVVKKNNVIVIDKKDEDKYLKQGWSLAEETELDEKTKWKMGDGRPRGAAYIENERFWDLDIDALKYIMKDANTAMKANPTGRKAGKYADEVNDAHTVIGWRKKNGIKEESELDEMNPRDKILQKTVDHLQALIKGSNLPDDNAAYSAARDYVGAGNLKTVADIVKKLDTEPKEAIINAVAKGMGKKEAEKIFKVKILRVEETESYEFGTDEYRKHTQEVTPGEPKEVDEASARADAKKAMRQDKKVDPADVDDDATDDDVKAASKNIIMQMRKTVSLRGNFKVEFGDKKKMKIPVKVAQAVQDKYNSIKKPADKEKFQAQVAKSYKDMLKVLKAGYNEEVEKETILDRIDIKLKERKNG